MKIFAGDGLPLSGYGGSDGHTELQTQTNISQSE